MLQSLVFTVGDIETAPELLTLTANSSDTNLIPVENIIFGGTGTNRTVSITPTLQAYGSSLITLTVSDGQLTASTSFTLTVNSPPYFQFNTGLTVKQGGTGVIAPRSLYARDVESGPERIVYTLVRPGTDASAHNGTVFLRGVALTNGAAFTQQDVIDGLLSYQNNGGCERSDDFGFNITDGDGGLTPTGQFNSFNYFIRVVLDDHPPIPFNGSGSVPLNARYEGILSATNTDCLSQTLTYRVLTNGAKGTMTITDPVAGTFVYTVHEGETGADRVLFQVNDGTQDATSPGVFEFVITNQVPLAHSQTLSLPENTVLYGSLAATDPDLPSQPLNFSTLLNGVKGTLTVTNPATGGFIYTPQAGRFGKDIISFKVNDGLADSLPGTLTVQLRHAILPGDLLVAAPDDKIIAVVDPHTGDSMPVAEGGHLSSGLFGLAVESGGSILAVDSDGGLLRIDLGTGAQEVVATNSYFKMPICVAVEKAGTILVSDPTRGIQRFGRAGDFLSSFPLGDLQFPAALALDSEGRIYVSDAQAFIGEAANDKIVRIDPATLEQTIITKGGYLNLPPGIVLDRDGSLLVADGGSYLGGVDRVLRVDPVTGSQSILTSGQWLSFPVGIALGADGDLVAANFDGSLVKIKVADGSQSILLPPGVFVKLGGVAVIPGTLPAPLAEIPVLKTSGRFVRFKGLPGHLYSLERSLDLTLGPWTALGTFKAPLSGVMESLDTEVASTAFYRVSLQR